MAVPKKSGRVQRKMDTGQSQSKAARRSFALFGILIAAGLGLLVFRSIRSTPSEETLLAGNASKKSDAPRPGSSLENRRAPGSWNTAPSGAADESGDVAQGRLDRARNALEGYKLWARYPPSSRPLSEMPDLQKPHSAQPSHQPLATSDGKVTKARVTLEQDRLYLVGDESARMSISCQTSDGPARCEVLSAAAGIPPTEPKAGTIGPNPVAFVDDGTGRVSAVFAPAKEGFSAHHGGIVIDTKVRIGSEEGSASFHFIYTPAPPARFTGKIREVLEDGSLCLYLEMAVDKPGRYVLAGRVDDAGGDGFGYLEWNDLLEAGQREACMCIFGLLVHDQRAESPFVLRDVEGYLLLEDRDPDRELMSVLEGKVYTTKTYPESAFSSAEWQSEEKTRHLEEYQNDVGKAEEGADESDKP
jgi:hypothetical protein